MGRTNGVIMAMGIGTILALSLMMQHVVGVGGRAAQHPVQQEILKTFGGRLDRPPELAVLGKGSGPRVVVTIYPILGVSQARLAREVGRFVWHNMPSKEHVKRVEVITVDLAGGQKSRLEVPQPFMARSHRQKAAPSRTSSRRTARPPAPGKR